MGGHLGQGQRPRSLAASDREASPNRTDQIVSNFTVDASVRGTQSGKLHGAEEREQFGPGGAGVEYVLHSAFANDGSSIAGRIFPLIFRAFDRSRTGEGAGGERGEAIIKFTSGSGIFACRAIPKRNGGIYQITTRVVDVEYLHIRL